MSKRPMPRIVLLGSGRMGGAMLSGWLAGGFRVNDVVVVDPAPVSEAPEGVQVFASIEAVARAFDGMPEALVVAVKPQILAEALAPLQACDWMGTLLLSIAAGKTVATLKEISGGCVVVRCMPNLPATIGKGITAAFAEKAVSPFQKQLATHLLQACGKVVWLEREDQMDAVTAISGSGPAYVFYLAECLEAAAIKLGLPAELATQLARETVVGSAALAGEVSNPVAELRQNVTSKGGTTEAALKVLMGENGLKTLMEQATQAACARAKELS